MNLSRTESNQAFPINKATIKNIKKKESDIQKKLATMNRHKIKSEQEPATEAETQLKTA
ncbi:TPA: hypothetical protein LTX07_004601 [Enterobacter hormaechei]|nr:hypothetical protein [Enterobacter hormaechei]